MNYRSSPILAILISFVVALAIASPGLYAPFYLDSQLIANNFNGLPLPRLRLVSYQSLLWQHSAFEMRLLNLFVHVLNSWLLLALLPLNRTQDAKRFQDFECQRRRKNLWNFLFLLILVCHPLAIHVSQYVIQRAELFAAFAFLLALNRLQRPQSFCNQGIIAILLLVAACCKESALILPIALALMARATAINTTNTIDNPSSSELTGWAKFKQRAFASSGFGLLSLGLIVFGLFSLLVLSLGIHKQFLQSTETVTGTVLTAKGYFGKQPAAIAHYCFATVTSFGIEFDLAVSLVPEFIAGVVCVLLIMILLTQGDLCGRFVTVALITLLPSFGLVVLQQSLASHRAYLFHSFLLLACFHKLTQWVLVPRFRINPETLSLMAADSEKKPDSENIMSPARAYLLWSLILVSLLSLFAWRSWQRQTLVRNPARYWAQLAQRQPQSYFAQYYLSQNQFQSLMRETQATSPKRSDSEQQAGLRQTGSRQNGSLEDQTEFMTLLRRVELQSQRFSKSTEFRVLLANIHLRIAREIRSQAQLSSSADQRRDLALKMLAHFESCVQSLQSSLDVNSDNIVALRLLARVYKSDLQDPKQALKYCQRALELAPESSRMWWLRAKCELQLGQVSEFKRSRSLALQHATEREKQRILAESQR